MDLTIGNSPEFLPCSSTSDSRNASKSQYEAAFVRWRIRKNLKHEDYVYVKHRLDKRKAESEESGISRESAVYFNDQRLPVKRIKKDLARHFPPSMGPPPAAGMFLNLST